jgi:hypothetical protein
MVPSSLLTVHNIGATGTVLVVIFRLKNLMKMVTKKSMSVGYYQLRNRTPDKYFILLQWLRYESRYLMMRFAAVEKMILAVSIPVSFLITPAQQYKKQISFGIQCISGSAFCFNFGSRIINAFRIQIRVPRRKRIAKQKEKRYSLVHC